MILYFTFAYFVFCSISNFLSKVVKVYIRLSQTDINSDLLSCLLIWGGEDIILDCFSIEPIEIIRKGED